MFTDLSAGEVSEFEECESVIARVLATFVEVGTALLKIRDKRLYRHSFDTFEDYCRNRWEMSRSRANQLVAAAGVVTNLTTVAAKPKNEAQARPLARLNPEQQREAWKRAIDAAATHKGKLTARLVEAATEEVSPRIVPGINPHALPDFAPVANEV